MGKLAERLSFVNFGDICKGCQVNCCRRFYAVLLEEEENEFNGAASVVRTRLGRLKTLGDPKGKVCPFLSNEGGCTIYERRPFDCRLWPVMVYYDFKTDEYIIILDLECPAAREGRIPPETLRKMVEVAKEARLKKKWVMKYTLSPWPKNYVVLERFKAPED